MNILIILMMIMIIIQPYPCIYIYIYREREIYMCLHVLNHIDNTYSTKAKTCCRAEHHDARARVTRAGLVRLLQHHLAREQSWFWV